MVQVSKYHIMSVKGLSLVLLAIAITIRIQKTACRNLKSEHLHALYFQRLDFKDTSDTNDTYACEKHTIIYEDRHNQTHVCFQAFGNQFHLILSEPYEPNLLSANHPILRPLKEILTFKMFSNIPSKVKLLQGKLEGHNHSYVIGYVEENVFCGYLETEYDSYDIDKTQSKNTTEHNAIVYRYDDLYNDICFEMNNSSNCHFTSQIESFLGTKAEVGSLFLTKNAFKVGQQKSTIDNILPARKRQRKISCKVNVIADHTYYNYHQRSKAAVQAEISAIFSAISEVFKNLDFNGDYQSDDFDIELQSLKIYPESDFNENPLSDDNLLPIDILKKLSAASQDFSCLSIAFVSRDFSPKKYLGMGFLGKSNPKSPDGGICSPYQYYPGFGKGRFNTLFVTNRYGRIALPNSVLQLLVFHLIGHAFGSLHDISDLICEPFMRANGTRYIAYESPVSRSLNTDMTFSTCSLMRMSPLIRNKGWCLSQLSYERLSKINGPCGNGQLDPGEECDCGTVDTCHFMDKCCVPAGKPNQCKIDKNKGYKCSSLDKCCNHNCQIANKWENIICDPWTECSDQRFCDGTEKCPLPVNIKKTNGYPCMGGSNTCRNGICNSTVCLDNNKWDCDCENPEDRCRICCQLGNQCVVFADSQAKFPKDVEPIIFKPAGSSCMKGEGICDVYGNCELRDKNCIFPDNVLGLDRRGDSPDFWANHGFHILMGVILVLFVIIALKGLSTYIAFNFGSLGNFEEAVLLSEKKLLGVPPISDSEFQLHRASRLSALFPYVEPEEIAEVTATTNTEIEAVASLLNKGHAMRTHFKIVHPPTLDLPV